MAKQIERIQRDFLWNGVQRRKKIQLLAWDVVCSPMQEGGLGLRRTRDLNKALLAKWIWRFGTEEGSLWKNIIVEKYGLSHNGWKSDSRKASNGLAFWKSICKLQSNTWRNISFKIGNGLKTYFWKDIWVSEEPLCQLFPLLFRCTANPDDLVGECISDANGTICWFPRFRRSLRDFELVDLIRLKGLIEKIHVDLHAQDSISWKLDPLGKFTVNSFFHFFSQSDQSSHPLAAIWKLQGPLRPKACLWLAGLDRLPTRKMLRKRGIQVTATCPFCEEFEKTSTHLFLQCRFAATVWIGISAYLNAQLISENRVHDFIVAWLSPPMQGKRKIIWNLSILAGQRH